MQTFQKFIFFTSTIGRIQTNDNGNESCDLRGGLTAVGKAGGLRGDSAGEKDAVYGVTLVGSYFRTK